VCGIVGYVGRRPVQSLLLAGLSKLEYRGYDSAGISVIAEDRIDAVRAVGNLSALRAKLDGSSTAGPAVALAERPATTGIGHTRWATHGRVSEANAHPHNDSADRVHVVVNGIVENYMVLKQGLVAAGSTFSSETDAEVIAHLIAHRYAGDLADAVRSAYAELEGHYAFVAMSLDEPHALVGARRECPLVVGRGEGEQFVASAVPAFLAETRRVQYVENGEIVVLEPDGVAITNASGEPVQRAVETVDWDQETAEKGGYETFMLKEIHEQADAVAASIADRTARGDGVDLDEQGALDEAIFEGVERVVVVACGTAYHAGLIGRYAVEEWARLQATREADGVLYTRAGLEVGVAATKTFVCQVAVMYLLALRLAELRGTLAPERIAELIGEIKRLPHCIDELIESCQARTDAIADDCWEAEFFLYIGRHVGLAVALEGALKLKEISYVSTDAYAAGEMKHGPIALLDQDTPVVCVATRSPVLEKLVSNIQEARARGAHVIAVTTAGEGVVEPHVEAAIAVPATDWMLQPILAVLPLQLLAYRIARRRGLNVDQPRNLAKTVTVE